jgi:pantoate--beta-alanine ligase
LEIATTIAQVRAEAGKARAQGRPIGLVPTMGALHEGHLALLRRAREEGWVVMSVFVNPTQFGPGEDFARYPRDLERDRQAAASVGADLVFAPAVEEIYPPGDATFVEVTGRLTAGLCGPHRPGHFRGVATVVAKLFEIVMPDRAYFGEKDYQQLQVIRRMATDLRLPIEIVGVPTVREADGLAASSRNAYLSREERRAAAVLYRSLEAARAMVEDGETDAARLAAHLREIIEGEPLARVQYVEVVQPESLEPVSRIEAPVVVALAAFVGKARLIDNLRLAPAEA